MKDCVTTRLRFETPSSLALESAFDGGRLTSDGGVGWLFEVDEELGLCQEIAKHVPVWLKWVGHHSLVALVSSASSRSPAATKTRTTRTLFGLIRS